MVVKIQNQMFNLSVVKYLMKEDTKEGKFFIGIYTTLKDMDFYFEYPTSQRRNEDWDRIHRDLVPGSLFSNKEIAKGN